MHPFCIVNIKAAVFKSLRHRKKGGDNVNNFYTQKKWKQLRKKILKRDGYKCQQCKRYGKNVPAVTVHHIKHLDEYPELAYTTNNLVSLCKKCHNKAHPEKGKKVGKY